MRRRSLFLATAGLLGVPALRRDANAQTIPKLARVGWIGTRSAKKDIYQSSLREGLLEKGWVEGRNLVIEWRWGEREQARELVDELVQAKVDVLVSTGAISFPVAAASGSVPLVFVIAGDPVEARFVSSLARPAVNRTGLTLLAYELIGKRLEILQSALLTVTRVAYLINMRHPGAHSEIKEAVKAAQRLGLTLQHVAVETAADFDGAFTAIARGGAQAIVTSVDGLMSLKAASIAAFAASHRVPAISGWGEFAAAGFLMTYGPSIRGTFRYLATYVDKILRGAKAADLPVEFPPKVELVVNLRTAKALGINLPATLRARADELIE